MDIKVGDLVIVQKPQLDRNCENDGLYWPHYMDRYDGQTGRVSDMDEDGFSFRIEGFDFGGEWSFRPSWVIKVEDPGTDENLVSSISVDELFG